MSLMYEDRVEIVAEFLHEQWVSWARAIMEEEDIDISAVREERWESDCLQEYEYLSEEMKEKDRKRARDVLRRLE